MKIGYLMQEGVPDIQQKPLSGAANHVVHVIQELNKAGHQVSLLIKLDGRIFLSDDLENYKPVDVLFFDRGLIRLLERVIRRIQYELKLPYSNFFESLRFACACWQELSNCDVYFERMGWLGYGGTIASVVQKIPLVVEVNGDHIDEFKSKGLVFRKSQHRLSYFLMKKTARYIAHVVATGEGWRQKYIERWGVKSSQVSVIDNGSALVDILKRESLRSFEPMISRAPLQVAYCGGFEVWHGIPILIYAVRRAIDRGCNLHVTLIGSGNDKSKIVKLIQELGLDGKFTFTGQVDIKELANYLAQADVGVSPYCGRDEYSGLKLLDYKAAGLAIIASGEKKQPSILKHGKTGWIVPPCDEEALCQAIIHLAEDHDLRREMGQEARIESETIHSWRISVEKLLNIFNNVIQNEN